MTSSAVCRGKQLLNFLVKKQTYIPLQAQKRCYAWFNDKYIDPSLQEDQLNVTEDDQRLYHRIRAAKKEETLSPLQYDKTIQKFINIIMKKGNKALAKENLEKAFETIKRIQLQQYHETEDPEKRKEIILDPVVIFHTALENCKPLLHLTRVRKGATFYQVPIPCSHERQKFLSMKFIISSSLDKGRKTPFSLKLAEEILSASKEQGKAFARKQDLHMKCEENKAFVNYRWT